MKQLLGIIFCMVFLGWVSVDAQETRRPKVSLKEHTYDFMEVMEGEVISHAFGIRNNGDGELKILRVEAG
jgi:hypothetical protein